MGKVEQEIGVKVPRLLFPAAGVDLSKWAVVACDQYTSQPEYWQECGRIVGDAPSALRLMLPEIDLGKPNEAERIAAIHSAMAAYLAGGVLRDIGEGLMLVRRTVAGKIRTGMLIALDLEQYDYQEGAKTLIRATEGTIVERIPPRLRIRENAPIEMPHILVLIDDPGRTVLEPLMAGVTGEDLLYDFELMQRGGHVSGYFIQDKARTGAALSALSRLANPAAFHERYGDDEAVLLFAMGDGNHSFATAKANWERVKANVPAALREDHPARHCLVEIENVHDAGIEFEPIHRILFGVDLDAALPKLQEILAAQNGGCAIVRGLGADAREENAHVLPFITCRGKFSLVVRDAAARLPVATLQHALDALLPALSGAAIDYVHGEDVVEKIGAREGNIGFFLPPMDKAGLFPTVIREGALARKTFSMGEANEKRYYLECRSLIK